MRKYQHEKIVNYDGDDIGLERTAGGERESAADTELG